MSWIAVMIFAVGVFFRHRKNGLVPIAPSVGAGLGCDPVNLAMMMQLASEMMRPVSPVAGIVIIMAGFAKTSPLAIVRRTWIPFYGRLDGVLRSNDFREVRSFQK